MTECAIKKSAAVKDRLQFFRISIHWLINTKKEIRSSFLWNKTEDLIQAF
jgi:hypothetical protein